MKAFEAWKQSDSRKTISEFVRQLAESLKPVPVPVPVPVAVDDGDDDAAAAAAPAAKPTTAPAAAKPVTPPPPSTRVKELIDLLEAHSALVDATPPLPQQASCPFTALARSALTARTNMLWYFHPSIHPSIQCQSLFRLVVAAHLVLPSFLAL